MERYWNTIAKEYGFAGVYFLYKKSSLNHLPLDVNNFTYEPIYSGFGDGWRVWVYKALSMLNIIKRVGPIRYSYDKTWKKILHKKGNQKKDGVTIPTSEKNRP